MSTTYLNYQREKLKEVLLYILSKTGDTGYFRLMKTLFCADRQNLIRWGDQITNVEYYARKHGPVPASVYDNLLSTYHEVPNEFSDILTVNGNFMMVHALREPNLDYLSETDKESLDKAIKELKGLNRSQIEKHLHEVVYNSVYAKPDKKYSQEDIALSGGASGRQIAHIRNEQNLINALQ